GQGQRAEYLRTHAGHLAQPARLHQPVLDETRGRTHRPDRMRGARSDADLEQVERADGHRGHRERDAAIVLVAPETAMTRCVPAVKVAAPVPARSPDERPGPLPARRLPPVRPGAGRPCPGT